MTAERWRQVQELFDAVVEPEPAAAAQLACGEQLGPYRIDLPASCPV